MLTVFSFWDVRQDVRGHDVCLSILVGDTESDGCHTIVRQIEPSELRKRLSQRFQTQALSAIECESESVRSGNTIMSSYVDKSLDVSDELFGEQIFLCLSIGRSS